MVKLETASKNDLIDTCFFYFCFLVSKVEQLNIPSKTTTTTLIYFDD